jgi:hypothetical protein
MMLSPQEQQALQQIELDLNSSDPDLAEERQTFTPCTGDRALDVPPRPSDGVS